MGMPGPISRSSFSIYDKMTPMKVSVQKGNPDPYNFRIDKHTQIENYLVLLVTYRGVTNYEGKKVLVYEDLTFEDVRKLKSLDPHFSDNKKFKSPIARFRPDITGWGMAIRFCKCMSL